MISLSNNLYNKKIQEIENMQYIYSRGSLPDVSNFRGLKIL